MYTDRRYFSTAKVCVLTKMYGRQHIVYLTIVSDRNNAFVVIIEAGKFYTRSISVMGYNLS